MTWIDTFIPTEQQWQKFRGSLLDVKTTLANKMEIGKYEG